MKLQVVGKNFIFEELHNLYFRQYNWNDEVKEDGMGGACSNHMGEKELIQGFGRKVRKDHYEDLDVGGKIILIWILKV
jgi:hypothetical protein